MKQYCKKVGSTFEYPQILPNQYENVVGGFDKLPDSELAKYGFFPYNQPEFDTIMQELDTLVFIPETRSVTHTVKNRVLDIVVEKANKVAENNNRLRSLLSQTDNYITRSADPTSGEPMPQWVNDQRLNYRLIHKRNEAEINSLTSVKDVLIYTIQF